MGRVKAGDGASAEVTNVGRLGGKVLAELDRLATKYDTSSDGAKLRRAAHQTLSEKAAREGRN